MTIFERISGILVASMMACASGVLFLPKPEPTPVVAHVEPIDTVLEAVHTYVAPRLHGVAGRRVPVHVARAVSEALVHSARAAGFDPLFVLAVVEVESRWHIEAVSPTGARGLMQLLPGTFAEVSNSHSSADPVENVRAGVAYLAYLYKGGKGFVRPESILRAYNGGPGTAMRYSEVMRAKGDLSVFSAEVRVYPGKVMAIYKRLVQAHGGDHKRPEKTWRLA